MTPSHGSPRTDGGPHRTTADQAIGQIHALLTQAGLSGMLMGHRQGVSVLSVNSELTIWAYSGRITWRHSNTDRHAPVSIHPLEDAEGAAQRILEHLGRKPASDEAGHSPQVEEAGAENNRPSQRIDWRRPVGRWAPRQGKTRPLEETALTAAPANIHPASDSQGAARQLLPHLGLDDEHGEEELSKNESSAREESRIHPQSHLAPTTGGRREQPAATRSRFFWPGLPGTATDIKTAELVTSRLPEPLPSCARGTRTGHASAQRSEVHESQAARPPQRHPINSQPTQAA